MMKKIVMFELRKMGYKVEEMETVKNGVKYDGFSIGTETEIAPVFYTNWISEMVEKNMSISAILDEIISVYEEHKSPDLNISEMFTREFLNETLNIALQKNSTEPLIKKASGLEGIEQYLYARKDGSDGSYSLKLKKEMLEKAQMSEEEAWEIAEKNTKDETILTSLLAAMGIKSENDDCDDEMLYILTNKSRTKGASAVLNREKIKEFAEKRKIERFIVFPSSVHEMLLMPFEKGMNLEYFSNMVKNINDKNVAPEERLTDRVYTIEF